LVVFTNIKCESFDKDFMVFEYVRLKSVNRTYKYVSGRVKLLKTPVNNIKVNMALYQRLNGYKPFLYNFTLDACKLCVYVTKFLKNQKSNPIASYFYGFLTEHSNMNHSCPYDHDIVVDRLSTAFMNHRLTNILPFPEGDYMIKTYWIFTGVEKALTKFYFTLS
ncbi:hypothetical protein KR054_005707, partial [Drosophila jambulina]